MKQIIILIATISLTFSCKPKKEDDYDVIVVKIPRLEKDFVLPVSASSKETVVDKSENIEYSSTSYDKPNDDEYNKALERIDLSAFSSEEIQAIKRDKPVQIWEPYCGQY
jgi:hypothetical protein